MKKYHILNGDTLKGQFPSAIEGEIIVLRECLVDGPVLAINLHEFYQIRARFISREYNINTTDYFDRTVPELEKIDRIAEGSEINFWFEDDLFCHVNFWFAVFRTLSRSCVRSLGRPKSHTQYGVWKLCYRDVARTLYSSSAA